MKKALASDYDGTLNFRHSHLYPTEFLAGDLSAIKDFQKKGGLFGICTGRPLYHITSETDPVGIHFDFYILMTGALILDDQQQVIKDYPIDCETGQKLHDYFGDVPHMVMADHTIYMNIRTDPANVLYFEDYSTFADTKVYDFSVEYQTEAEAAAAAKEVNRLFPMLHAYQNLDSIDIVSHQASKGKGLKQIKEALGIDLMGAIGDSFNDIPMLLDSDLSFTFKRCSAIRRYAKNYVDTIADAIEIIEDL